MEEYCRDQIAEIVTLFSAGEESEAIAKLGKALHVITEDLTVLQRRKWFWEPFQVIAAGWNSKEGHFVNGEIQLGLNDKLKAITFYDKAIQIDASYALAFYRRGTTYFHLGHQQKAIDDLTMAIKLDSDLPGALNNRGVIYRDMGDHQRALADFDEAIAIDAKYALAHKNRGKVFSKLKNFSSALADFTRAIYLNSTDEWSYYNRATAFADDGQEENAISDLEKFLQLSNSDFWKKRAFDLIEELRARLRNVMINKVAYLIDEISSLLKFSGTEITHYSSLTVAKLITFGKSPFRISEASFMNDTSEGKQLIKFLELHEAFLSQGKGVENTYLRKPFFGCFVTSEMKNDLAMWRLYGKEGGSEASGASITFNSQLLIEALSSKIASELDENDEKTAQDVFQLYQIAYINSKGGVVLPAEKKPGKAKKLSEALKSLKETLVEASEHKERDGIANGIWQNIAKIMYLFKTEQYQYEKEVRLMVSEAGFQVTVNTPENSTPKVYIELASIHNAVTCVTLGPKVTRPDEWMAAFHYSLDKEGVIASIQASELPYK